MSALDEMREDVGELGFALEIAGLQYRYYSVGDPASSNLDTHLPGTSSGVAYVNVPLLESVGEISSQVDPAGGVAEYKPIEILLNTLTLYADSEGDPGRVFSRLGRRSVGLIAYLSESAGQTDTQLFVDRDLSGLSYPRLMQLGGETLWATAAAAVAPYDITVVRGVAGTVPQIHDLNEAAADIPELLPEVAAWRSRRAVLYACRIRPDGSASDYIELMRGFIDQTPNPDGDLVRLNLVPLPGLLDVELESPRKPTRLLHGWHYFQPPYGITVEMALGYLRGDGPFAGNPVGAPIVGPPEGQGYSFAASWTASFDPTLSQGHPRKGRLALDGAEDVEIDTVAAGVLYLGAAPATLPGGVWPNEAKNSTVVEIHRIDLRDPADGGAVLAWPDALTNAINSAAGWAPGTYTGLTGQWMDVLLNDADEGGASLTFTYNDSARSNGITAWFWSDARVAPEPVRDAFVWESGEAEPPAGADRLLWFGADFAEPESTDYPSRQRTDRPTEARAWWRSAQFRRGSGGKLFIRGLALAYYQTGEQYILVEDDVFVAAGSRTSVEITYHDRRTGETNHAVARITASTAVTHPTTGVNIGYRLTVADEDRWRLPAFGDWPGTDSGAPPPRVTITPIVRWTAQRPERLLLELLTSAGGAQANGNDDVLPFGAEIHHEDVDTNSMGRWSAPPGMEQWTQRFEDGMSLADVLKWPLLVSGTALTMRRDQQGRCRLARISVGVESRADALGTITQADIIQARWGRNDELVNLHEVQFDWTETEDKPRSTVKWHDRRSQRTYRQVKARKYPLRGLTLPALAAGAGGNADAIVRPLVSRQRVLYGDPRRTITLTVGLGTGLLAELGATYLVTHPELKGYTDDWGLVEAPMRVLAVNVDLKSGTATLVGEIYDVNATGYNATATVQSVPAADAVITVANVDADDEHPYTGAAQLDCDGFAAGDAVVYRPPGDHDNAVSLTVQAVDRATRKITFTGAHGITPHGAIADGGTIEPDTYSVQSAAHQALANLSDAAGTLGAGADDGFDLG